MRDRYYVLIGAAGWSASHVNEVFGTLAAAGAAGLVWWKLIDKVWAAIQRRKAEQLRLKQQQLDYEQIEKTLKASRPDSDYGGPHHLL